MTPNPIVSHTHHISRFELRGRALNLAYSRVDWKRRLRACAQRNYDQGNEQYLRGALWLLDLVTIQARHSYYQ